MINQFSESTKLSSYGMIKSYEYHLLFQWFGGNIVWTAQDMTFEFKWIGIKNETLA